MFGLSIGVVWFVPSSLVNHLVHPSDRLVGVGPVVYIGRCPSAVGLSQDGSSPQLVFGCQLFCKLLVGQSLGQSVSWLVSWVSAWFVNQS